MDSRCGWKKSVRTASGSFRSNARSILGRAEWCRFRRTCAGKAIRDDVATISDRLRRKPGRSGGAHGGLAFHAGRFWRSCRTRSSRCMSAPGHFSRSRQRTSRSIGCTGKQFAISGSAAAAINGAKRIVAVGTTTVRVLESAERRDERILPQDGRDRYFHSSADASSSRSIRC